MPEWIRWGDLVNCSVVASSSYEYDGDELLQGATTGSWNAGALSSQSYNSGNIYIEFGVKDPPGTGTQFIIGLSTGPNIASTNVFSGLQSYLGLLTSGQLIIGSQTVWSGAYSSGDLFRIGINQATSTWSLYQNGALCYSGSASSADSVRYPLRGHVAMYGGTGSATLGQSVIGRDGVEIDLLLGGPSTGYWVDVTNDCVAREIALDYGIQGTGPFDMVAGAGTLTFTLDNGQTNSGALLGYYAIGSTNCRSGFTLGIPVRLALSQGGKTYHKFLGWLDAADPMPGQYGERLTRCVAVDWMDEAARARMYGVETQTSQTSDVVMSAVIAAVGTTPSTTDFDTGASTFKYALDNSRREETTILGEIQRITQSEYGRCYIKGSTGGLGTYGILGGGVLAFDNRTSRLSPTSVASFSNNMLSMGVGLSRDGIINKLQVVTHPRRVDSGTTQVLFALQSVPLVTAGTTIKISGLYNDPSNRAARVGGTDMVSPASTTDYTMDTVSTGGGTALTTGFTVTADYGGDGVDYTIVNNTTLDGYITKLQARGRGLYDYDPVYSVVASTSSQDSYGLRNVQLDMPYESDVNTAEAVATYIVDSQAEPVAQEVWLGLCSLVSSDIKQQVFAREPGDIINVVETAAGLVDAYQINGVSLRIEPGPIVWSRWLLAKARIANYWILDSTSQSQLDETTILSPL